METANSIQVVVLNRIRHDSFVQYLKSHYKDIEIVDTIEVDNDAQKTYQSIYDMLRRHSDLDAVYSTTSMQMQLVKAIEDAGRRGRVKAVVFDKNQEIFECIKKGIIAATIDHDAFTQGYYPIVLMYNHLVAGMELNHERIMCKASVVDEDNIDEHIDI